ncbi:hypothetical protein CLV56_2273 [Mumia flava]|uniref:FtsX-like permease family protein n=2 Tax=Mumia flava TaxID=1348852 RepID=A0A2M9BJC9_9ACTN|nr:hypothetical protein CLV56_2273 [Mumia flava]
MRLVARIVLRTWRPRSRHEWGTIGWAFAGSAMIVVAAALVLAQLASYGARSAVLESRSPVWTDGEGPWVNEASLDVGTGELVLVHLGPRDPVVGLPPGVDRWPGAGEVIASPAVTRERDSNVYLAELVRGVVIGDIAADGLRDPDERLAYVGATEHEIRELGGVRISGFGGTSGQVEDLSAGERRMVALWGLVILLAGIAALVLVLGRLAAAGKQRRYAVLRLLGAPERSVVLVTGISTMLASTLGGMVGIVLAGPVIRMSGSVPFVPLSRWPVDLAALLPALAAVAALVGAATGTFAARSAAGDPWRVRRRGADRRLSSWRLLPLASAALVVGALAAAQQARVGSGAATPMSGVWLLVGGILLAWWGLILSGPVLVRGAAALGRRGPLSIRVAAARTDHHARATSRLAAALVTLMLVVGVAGGAIAGATDDGTDGWRLIELDSPDAYSDPAALRRAVAAALGARGVEEAWVTRANTRDRRLLSADGVRSDDFGYTFVVADEALSGTAAAIVEELPQAAGSLIAGYPAGERRTAMTSAVTILALMLCLMLLTVALGLSVAAMQAEREDADRALLASGMGRSRLRSVRGAEVVLATLPGPLAAAAIGSLVAVAAACVDDVAVPVPSAVLIGLACAPLACAFALAGVAALLTPRAAEVARRRE